MFKNIVMPEKFARLNLNLDPDEYLRMHALSVCLQRSIVSILTEGFRDFYAKVPKETRSVVENVVKEAKKHSPDE